MPIVEIKAKDLKAGQRLLAKGGKLREFTIVSIIPGIGGPYLTLIDDDDAEYEHDTSFDMSSTTYSLIVPGTARDELAKRRGETMPDDPKHWSIIYVNADKAVTRLGPVANEKEALVLVTESNRDGVFDIDEQHVYLLAPNHVLTELTALDLLVPLNLYMVNVIRPSGRTDYVVAAETPEYVSAIVTAAIPETVISPTPVLVGTDILGGSPRVVCPSVLR